MVCAAVALSPIHPDIALYPCKRQHIPETITQGPFLACLDPYSMQKGYSDMVGGAPTCIGSCRTLESPDLVQRIFPLIYPGTLLLAFVIMGVGWAILNGGEYFLGLSRV